MRKKLIIIGAICVLLAAAFFGGIALFTLKARKAPTTPISSASTITSNSISTPFATVPERDIPGRYKWISGSEEYFITLYDDHTFLNKSGAIHPKHGWRLAPEGLVIKWISNESLFDRIEAPGIYTGPKSDGTRRRMEKQLADPSDLLKPEPLPPPDGTLLSQMVTGDVVASIRFGAQCETNKLTPRNTGGGDGKIFPGNIGGVDCYQLVRKPARPEAYLYLHIAPEVKEPPFTNAMVVVEYFDAVPGDVRASLGLQYDSKTAAYHHVPQRIPLTGSETWKEAWFLLEAPAFQNRQNAQGDFRVTAANPDLFVRSVKLLKNLRPAANDSATQK